MSRKGKTRYSILVMLSIQPMSGYDIKQYTEEVLSNFWSESYGQIYTNLKTLIKEGLATATVVQDDNKPAKTVYEITDKGKSELKSWLAEPVSTQVPRDELSLKLFVAPLIPPEVSLQHISSHREQQQQQLDKLEKAIAHMELDIPDHVPHKDYWIAGSKLGIYIREARIKWCNEMEAMVRKKL